MNTIDTNILENIETTISQECHENIRNIVGYKTSYYDTIELHANGSGRLMGKIHDAFVTISSSGAIRSEGVFEAIGLKSSQGRTHGHLYLGFKLLDAGGHPLQTIENVVNLLSWHGCNSRTRFSGGRTNRVKQYDATHSIKMLLNAKGIPC